MFSPRNSHMVLEDLGQPLLRAVYDAVEAAREDYLKFRETFSEWQSALFEREIAGFIHSRLWFHLVRLTDGLNGVSDFTSEPYRELKVCTAEGRTYEVRVKRHDRDDQISSAPTRRSLEFWAGNPQSSFEGLETVPLAVGYYWDSETRTMGASILSYREGQNNVIWSEYLIHTEDGGTQKISQGQESALPTLPEVDLYTASQHDLVDGAS